MGPEPESKRLLFTLSGPNSGARVKAGPGAIEEPAGRLRNIRQGVENTMIKIAEFLLGLIRAFSRVAIIPLIWILMPVKLFAWRTSVRCLKQFILEITGFIDFVSVFALVQNHAMLAHYRVYRGNFIFGKSLMVVDHEKAEKEIALPTLRGNRFMGVDIVSNDPAVFLTNAGPINSSQPVRGQTRAHIEETIMTDRVRGYDLPALKDQCATILEQWREDGKMATILTIRTTVTRLFFQVLADQCLPPELARKVTFAYMRRFAEFSLFSGYTPFVLGLLGSREAIRRDAFLPLRRLGIDNVVIDMVLFAAMFSIGTIVCKCVEFASKHQVDYRALDLRARMNFVVESLRVYPTVTSVHRIVENEETIIVRGRELRAQPGDEVAYPFVCINRDSRVFGQPEAFKIDRPEQEMARILSWSRGPHNCPARDLSILMTILMLDTLAERHDLRKLHIFSPEF